MKVLVLYVFHEYNERVKHFFENAIFDSKEVDFMIICNNKDLLFEYPSYTNVKKYIRENIGYDFGGWSDALLTEEIYKNYDNFIFVNSSVIGPFMKKELKDKYKWTDLYCEQLEKYKLFGSTINLHGDAYKNAHVQSYIFCMNKETLEYLINCEIFSNKNYEESFEGAIFNREVLMSRKIIEKGWNIGSFLKIYGYIDFTKNETEFKKYMLPPHYDLMYEGSRNIFWNEYDLIFIKGNRIKINN
jgi:hypothetical protein